MVEASVVWTDDKQFVAESGSRHAFVMDAGPELGGRSSGPSPTEVLLAALAGCTGLDVVFILKDKMRRPLTGLRVEVTGDRAEVSPKVLTEVQLRYQLRGPGLPAKDALRAIQLSLEKYCSVSAMVARTARIHASYQILDEATGQTTSGELEHPTSGG